MTPYFKVLKKRWTVELRNFHLNQVLTFQWDTVLNWFQIEGSSFHCSYYFVKTFNTSWVTWCVTSTLCITSWLALNQTILKSLKYPPKTYFSESCKVVVVTKKVYFYLLERYSEVFIFLSLSIIDIKWCIHTFDFWF